MAEEAWLRQSGSGVESLTFLGAPSQRETWPGHHHRELRESLHLSKGSGAGRIPECPEVAPSVAEAYPQSHGAFIQEGPS